MAEIIVSIDGKDDPEINKALEALFKKKNWPLKGKYQTSAGYVLIFEDPAARKDRLEESKRLQGPGVKK